MTLQKFVQSLVRPQSSNRQLLPAANPRDPIGAKTGVGKGVVKNAESAVVGSVRVEIITVYSHLVITADGAFEMPPGWPSNGDYPAGTPVPQSLPDSLIYANGVLSLDTGADYYQQQRAHIAVYINKGAQLVAANSNVPVSNSATDTLAEDRFYVPLAMPFDISEYYSGIDRFTQIWEPEFEMVRVPNAGSLAATRVQELIAAGVVLVN